MAMNLLRRTAPETAETGGAPATVRVAVSDLVTWGCPLAQDDTLPDGWGDPNETLHAATITWADHLGLGTPGIHCDSLSEHWSERHPLDAEEPRSTGSLLETARRHTRRATLCGGQWILVVTVSESAERDVLANGEPVDRCGHLEVAAGHDVTLAWGPWRHRVGDTPSAKVLPARVDLLTCYDSGWRLTIGDEHLDVDEPFALAVLAAHH